MTAPQHLLDLIRQVRPKAALFTTYTFSVGYFDAVFVPVLRSVGCQDIVVLVDANEAARSAKESASRAAGRVYRIAPVIAPGGGVFHPKLAYFATELDDVLAVSSGNLTASGQSLQLESFDAVSAKQAPTVFLELAEWMTSLSALVKKTSPQAAVVLERTVPRARQAHRRNADSPSGALPWPTLVHTLDGTARDSLEALFIAEADRAERVVVHSPFHTPDGGPLLRLAKSVDAETLAVGLDGGRQKLVAPFERGRFKPEVPAGYVLPDAPRAHRRLHAKVFELQARGKVLVMTGSVNATVQSFESTKNVEVSLARWLIKSPFSWKEADPLEYEATQTASDFQQHQALYVDAWIDDDWILHGRLTSRTDLSPLLELTIHRGEVVLHVHTVTLDSIGEFTLGPMQPFDASQALLLTVSDGQVSTSCWLNVQEELDIAMDERERRAAVARVLRGEYAPADIAEIVRLLTTATQALATKQTAALRRPAGEAKTDGEVPFSFLRWECSGHERGGNTLLGRGAHEWLRAITRWMNADLAAPSPDAIQVGISKGVYKNVELLGGTEEEEQSIALPVDPYVLLDQLCITIPIALERQPGLEHGAVLAEIVASRAVNRALTQDLKMAPCVSWLDRFSRFFYPEAAQAGLGEVAAAMASVSADRLVAQGLDPQFAVQREAVERLLGCQLSPERWVELTKKGLERELFRRVAPERHASTLSMSNQLALAETLDDSLLSLLHKASTMMGRHALVDESEAATFPEIAASLSTRKPKKLDLKRGLISEVDLARKGSGCPHCGQVFSGEQISALKQKHALLHKGMLCNRIVLLADAHGHLRRGIEELPDA